MPPQIEKYFTLSKAVIETEKKKNCAVILATHNGSEYLKTQLTSIKNQIGVNTKFYYSDDASRDNSQELAKKFGCVNLNSVENVYGSSAANFINAICKYETKQDEDYIFLSDQDDIWLPDKMIVAINTIENSQSDIYSGSFFAWNTKDRKVKYVNKNFKQNDIDYFFRSPGPGFTFCFSRSAFEEIQLHLRNNSKAYINVRWHDWLIYAIARKLGKKWYIDCKPFSLYRLHSKNDTGQIISLNHLNERIKFLLNGNYRDQVNILFDPSRDDKLARKLKRFNWFDRICLISKIPLMRTKLTDRLALLIWLVFERRKNVN